MKLVSVNVRLPREVPWHGRNVTTGIYKQSVAGHVSLSKLNLAGDEIKVISREKNAVPVSEVTRLYIAKRYSGDDVASLRRALRVAALPESWKEYFRERLERANV